MIGPRVGQVQDALIRTAGGFLRNPGGPGTCSRCFTPTPGPMCPDCRYASQLPAGPDLVGMLTYAGYLDPIMQSGRVMRGYKNPAFPGGGTYRQTVALLAALGLKGHTACAGRIVGLPVTRWATVPSLPPKDDRPQQPLNVIVARLARSGASEVHLEASRSVSTPRAIKVDHFTASDKASGQHVMVVEDTWTGGGHATSAALAVRAAGATHVSVLVLARWLTLGWGSTTKEWARQRLTSPDFQPEICPWTNGPCP